MRRAIAWLLGGALLATGTQAQLRPAGSDIPADVRPVEAETDFVKRVIMITMRDGVKLNTIIVMPETLKDAPIILTRTPYGAAGMLKGGANRIEALLPRAYAELAAAGYIVVLQDIRGRFGSDGDYHMLRPLAGTLDRSTVDHSTDAYDTIDWLVKNLPESNGRVGIMGGSYGGFTALMALIDPHPALKAAVPINPVVDVWTGDDLFHNGALRQTYLDWVHALTTDKSSNLPWPEPRYDSYETWLSAGNAANGAKAHGMENLPYWRRMIEHPSFDAYWQEQALDRILAKRRPTVPTLHVHSQWDQEDIYGAPAVYAAMEPGHPANDRNFLVIGPWRHGSATGVASELGPLKFGEDSAATFRRTMLIPFLDAHLKPGAPASGLAPVTAFETGSNRWLRHDRWPLSCAGGCPAASTSLYLQPGGALGPDKPAAVRGGFDHYVSDPAKPVTYRLRPIRPTYGAGSTWDRWLLDDQRFAADRPDVLTYVSPVLTDAVHVAGQPIMHLAASTSGTDSDWIVKLIDVYPDQVADQPELGGYQLPVAMEIFRGRYHRDPARAEPLPANRPVDYTIKLPNASHVFRPGHRIMIQIQSSWFPLYDRNPQSFVPNIFFAPPAAYVKATQRVYRTAAHPSRIELPVIPTSTRSTGRNSRTTEGGKQP